ncbi:MAG TPA: hypothetical protein VFT29_11180 [Gemmatimonadaceae bacterium]|nr:hypothetical protein [Gemmatimonadaceae bacterium]
MRTTNRLFALGSLLALTAFVKVGPPWISIEYPANPYDSGSRGAFLLVHAFHHGTPVSFPVSGTAEGLVNGTRRTISLEFKNTSRPGVYALNKQWPTEGVWTLVVGVTQGDGDFNTARAVVELSTEGRVVNVNVPTRVNADGYTVPAAVSMADVEAGLRARAGRVASR